MRGAARAFGGALLWTLALTAAVALGVSGLLGVRSLAVLSASMRPAIDTGDLVVTRSVPPAAVRGGDVVTFRDPEGGRRLLTHRVRSVQARGDTVDLTTKGDAANAVERWTVDADGRVGRVTHRFPKLGHVMRVVQGPYGRLALVVVPAALLALSMLRTALPRSGRRNGDTGAAAAGATVAAPAHHGGDVDEAERDGGDAAVAELRALLADHGVDAGSPLALLLEAEVVAERLLSAALDLVATGAVEDDRRAMIRERRRVLAAVDVATLRLAEAVLEAVPPLPDPLPADDEDDLQWADHEVMV